MAEQLNDTERPRGMGAQENDRTSGREKVQLILKWLAKYVQGKKIYAPNNPILDRFSKELRQAWHDFISEEPALVLEVEQFDLKWQGEEVYRNERRDESIAFILYKDGIGEITFKADLAFEELDRFADIIKEETHSRIQDEDVVTRMWKADFKNISYRVLDEYLSGEFGEGKEAASEPSPLESTDHPELIPSFKDRGRVIVEAWDPIESLDDHLRRLVSASGEGDDSDELYEQALASLFKIGSEELRMFHEALLQERSQDQLIAFLTSILDFTLLVSAPSVVRDTANIIDRVMSFLLEERRPSTLKKAYLSIKNFKEEVAPPDSTARYLDKLINSLARRDFLLSLCEGITQWSKAAEELVDYLRALGRPATDAFVRLLEQAESEQLRRAVGEALVAVWGERIEQVLEKLNLENKAIALSALAMAAQAGLNHVPSRLGELIYYPDEKVRVECVRFLSSCAEGEALNLLLVALGDEGKHVRMKAVSALEKRSEAKVKEKLGELAFSKETATRDMDEQEMIFRVLGSIGDEQTLARIKEMVGKKRLLSFGKGRESKLLAIRALEMMAADEAASLLEELSKDSNKLISSRARRALARRRAGAGPRSGR